MLCYFPVLNFTYINDLMNFTYINDYLICFFFQKALADKSIDIQKATQLLSDCILNKDNATIFKKYLSNILLALVSAKIPLKAVFSTFNYDTCNDTEKTNHLEYSIVLAALTDHPDVLQ